MPKQIPQTGNLPAPTPNSGQALNNPQPIATIQLDNIRMIDGLYCFNDLHKMAGGKPKDTPSRFIILAKTQALIKAFERLAQTQNPKKGFDSQNPKKGSDLSQVVRVIHGGDMQGVYGCKPLMFAYTSWINADFHALVYTVFNGVTNHFTTPRPTLTQRYNEVYIEHGEVKSELSVHASKLCVLGKQVLPSLEQELNELLAQMQPQLPFLGVAMTTKPITTPKAGKPKATKPAKKQADNSPALELATIRALINKPAPYSKDPTTEIFNTFEHIPDFYKGGEWDYDGLAKHIFNLKGLADKLVKDCTGTFAERPAIFHRLHVGKYLSAINDDNPEIADFDELSHNMTQSLISVHIIYLLGGITWNA